MNDTMDCCIPRKSEFALGLLLRGFQHLFHPLADPFARKSLKLLLGKKELNRASRSESPPNMEAAERFIARNPRAKSFLRFEK
jgi:hypothetical protein